MQLEQTNLCRAASSEGVSSVGDTFWLGVNRRPVFSLKGVHQILQHGREGRHLEQEEGGGGPWA